MSFVLLMTRPPQRSTLFPYTTLFRSELRDVHLERHAVLEAEADGDHERVHEAGQRRALLGDVDEDVARGDRKSTRLNSSHSQISYAVFCLKKKTRIPWCKTEVIAASN